MNSNLVGNENLFNWCDNASGGCAAKSTPFSIEAILESINLPGFPPGSPVEWDDVGILHLIGDQILVASTDMITPIVNDAYLFGKIATAHSLSDIYAKGVKPIGATDILIFPNRLAPIELAQSILKGVTDQLNSANALLLGGHTLSDSEIKLGLTCFGLAKHNEVIACSSAKEGDRLFLTKKLGTGVISTALKRFPEKLEARIREEAIQSMETLNDFLVKAEGKLIVNASTDVTGFGLAGSLWNMVKNTKLSAKIFLDRLPFFDGLPDLIEKGISPTYLHHNMDFLTVKHNAVRLRNREIEEDTRFNMLFDPQTSGGLLISIASENIQSLLSFASLTDTTCFEIGEIVSLEVNQKALSIY